MIVAEEANRQRYFVLYRCLMLADGVYTYGRNLGHTRV